MSTLSRGFRPTLALLLLAGAVFLFSACDSSDPDLDGDADITGLVLDSQQGSPVVGATVTFRRGNAERQGTTDATGTFLITDIATGTYTMSITADGFLEVVLENVVITDGLNELDPTVVTEAPPAGAYRIVLTWGQRPSDLDSHLTGPTAGGERFHVYFVQMNPVSYASLDRDDVTSFGPETITVTPEVNGMYRYSVFNFSDQSTQGSQGIAGEIDNSTRARVQVYSSTGLVREFLAPPSTPGNTWRVFEMNATGGTATITSVNTYVTASGSSDMGTFRPADADVKFHGAK
jgi:hypothetical protein